MISDKKLISEAKKYLDGYHIDLSKYKTLVNRNCGNPFVCFTADSEHKIYVSDCCCDEDNILQAEIYIE